MPSLVGSEMCIRDRLNDLMARVNDLEGNQSDTDNAISGASKTYRNFDRRLKALEQQLNLSK